LLFLLPRRPPRPTLFPYTTLFRSVINRGPLWQRSPADPCKLQAMLAALRVFWVEQKRMYLRVSPAVKSGEIQESLFHGAGYQSADRKSTRLNSSHVSISYAVFCLK